MKEVLKKLPLFSGLEDTDIDKIAQVTKERSVAKGETIFKTGEIGDAFYFLREGVVEVLKADGGEERVVNTIKADDASNFFGEMALIEGAPRSATIRAAADSKLLFIAKSDFDMMLRLNSFISLRIMSALSKRLRTVASTEPAVEEKIGKSIVLFSPSGGTGKSVLALNLAAGLARYGKAKVLVIDLDLQFGDLAFMLQVKPKRTIADLVSQPTDKPDVFKEYLTEHPAGFSMLPAPHKPEQSEMVASNHLKAILGVARRCFDYIIIDTHCLFQDLTINALDLADLVFLVMAPKIGHIWNMRKCLDVMKNLKYPEDKIKLVLNRSGAYNSLPADEVGKNLPCKISFSLADDYQNVNQLTENSKLIFDHNADSPFAKDLKRVVSALIGSPVDEVRGDGILGRIKGWFS